jgi:hypothetical protein
LSFFDEDDEPRRSPRPRRARPAGDAAVADRQTVRMRQGVLLAVSVLVVILLVLVVRGCMASAKENALKDYNREVASLIADSDRQVGGPFFELLGSPGQESATDLQTSISGFRVQAEQQYKQAQNLDVPDEMVAAQRSFLMVLEFRRDGLAAVAEQIRAALSDDAEAADGAINDIAGQMQEFLASDVIHRARVQPLVKRALDDAEIGGQTIATSQFLPGVEWISAAYVADRLGQQSRSGDGQRRGQPAPGLHGNGLQGVSAGDVTLQPDAPNRIPASTRDFVVRFTNQGENDEFDVKVMLRITAGNKRLSAQRTIDTVRQGATAEASLRLEEALPAAGTSVVIRVEVQKVPGEEKVDNNRAEYDALVE